MIDVLLFAGLKEAAGQEKLQLNISGLTIKEMKEKLIDLDLPNAKQAMIAVNEEFATDEYIVQHGDVVALIPPVSGG